MTFLCSEYCAVQRISQNVYPGSHSRSFPSLGGLLPSLTSHFSVMTSLRKSIQCGRIEECLLYLKYPVTRKTSQKPFSNFRVIVSPINIVWAAIFWGNIGRYANPHDNDDDDDDESRDEDSHGHLMMMMMMMVMVMNQGMKTAMVTSLDRRAKKPAAWQEALCLHWLSCVT